MQALSISTMATELRGLPREPGFQLLSLAPAEPALASVTEQNTPASPYLPALARPFKARTAGRWRYPGILCHSKLCCHVDKSICPMEGSSLPPSLQLARNCPHCSLDTGLSVSLALTVQPCASLLPSSHCTLMTHSCYALA